MHCLLLFNPKLCASTVLFIAQPQLCLCTAFFVQSMPYLLLFNISYVHALSIIAQLKLCSHTLSVIEHGRIAQYETVQDHSRIEQYNTKP